MSLAEAQTGWRDWLRSERRLAAHTLIAYEHDVAGFLGFMTTYLGAAPPLEALAEQAEGTAMMVPLTDSLYAPGKLGSTDKVLLDIGTGYFVEVRWWRQRAGAAQP